MEEQGRQVNHFVAYEYKEIIAESSQAYFLLDGYECFGWELDEKLAENTDNPAYQKKIVLRLKRNRKIINKMELTRLQRNFEACVGEIQSLEKAKTSKAAIWAFVVAFTGTAFMAGATFAVTAPQPQYVLMAVLALPGILGWTFPYFVYRKIRAKQTEKMNVLIETKYDEIYEICEKGNKLLH
ncbi:MAG: hypothetical protein NC429_06230 [Lachnospiraceae bacterium]|nr:hypothetical protein [Lachnospiraceae bacterium]